MAVLREEEEWQMSVEEEGTSQEEVDKRVPTVA